MAIVDEQGRLFGVVNVIDLAVAVVVLATLVAGAAVVLGEDPAPPEQRYATVVLEDRPSAAPQRFDGTSVDLGRLDGEITDSYRAPTTDGEVRTILRLELEVSAAVANRSTGTRLATEDDAYLVGEEVGVTSGEASYRGYLGAVSEDGADLPVRRVNATVLTRVPPEVADQVAVGDTQMLAGQETARLHSVERRGMAANRTRLRTTVSIRAIAIDGSPRYGDRRVRPGATLAFGTGEYEFTGTITEVETGP